MVASLILFGACQIGGAGEVLGQEKNKFERLNKKKNKKNRRLKRRGDRGKSNRSALRSSMLKTRNRQGERAYKGDITGRKVVTKSTKRSNHAGYVRPNPYAGRKRRTENDIAKKVLSPARFTARPSENPYDAPSKSKRFNSISDKRPFAGKAKYQGGRFSSISKRGENPHPGGGKGTSYNSISNKAGFAGKRKYHTGGNYATASRRGEQAQPRGGKGLTFNSISAKSGFAGKRKYQGAGGRSASKRGEQAASRLKSGGFGSISGRITFSGKSRYQGRNVRSATRPSESKAVSGRVRPRSASGAYSVRSRRSPYSAFRKQKPWERAFKGDITGRTFRTKYTTERPSIQKQRKIRYSERTGKGDRPTLGVQPGYISVTKKPESPWNESISGKRIVKNRRSPRPDFSGAGYYPYPQGKRKGDVAFKGKLKDGGFRTASRRGESPAKSLPRSQRGDVGIPLFTGNIKSQKPLKGGGSISNRNWNNNGNPITKNNETDEDRRAMSFQGNVKAGKPKKGGGSMARDSWNNKGESITRASNNEQDKLISKFTGNVKTGKPEKGGGSISRSGWNNGGEAITRNDQSEQGRRAMAFQGNIKRRFKYAKNPNSVDEALKVRDLSRNAADQNTLTTRVRLPRKYDKKPNAADGSLMGIGPSKAAIAASDYQGNIKMNKKRISDAHPSMAYKRLQNSATQEREKLFSFKLLFSKIFKKNEAQPEVVKKKERTPRFDKREREIWYE